MSSESDEIRPINLETVHRICSGQVVLSLAIAVKELIENAIDVGAKNIEVRIKNYGLDAIEVVDNGSGVQEKYFAALTIKHCTSKIREFDDLESVCTLGFRGEALSSLCALSDLTIITRHKTCEHGTKLQYDHNGDIKTKSIAARSVGTTVQLSNLFSTLPVRRKEFNKNYKREFNKMCSLLHAYCLVYTDIKFTCSNQVSGSKNIILSTLGHGSVSENIVNIFGAKQAQYLFEVPLVQPDEPTAADYGVKEIPKISPFEFEFLMSSVAHGCGRSATDRQFLFVNSRPCEPMKVIKIINETYKSFNSAQYPFIFLNIKVLKSLVDVNVTPDKRQVYLEKEKLLFATIKKSLIEAFKNFPSTYKYNNLDVSTQQEQASKRKLNESSISGSFKTFLDNFKKRPKLDSEFDTKSNKITTDIKCPNTPKKGTQKPLVAFIKTNTDPVLESKLRNGDEFNHIKGIDIRIVRSNEDFQSHNAKEVATHSKENDSPKQKESEMQINSPDIFDEIHNGSNSNIAISPLNITEKKDEKCEEKDSEQKTLHSNGAALHEETRISKECGTLLSSLSNKKNASVNIDDSYTEMTISTICSPSETQESILRYDSPVKDKNKGNVKYLDFTIDSIKQAVSESQNISQEKNNMQVKFRAEITPKANNDAETELQKQFSKDMFKEMKIVGQFNYAFIIAMLDQDVFIIDQHAADEKYNFEMLQRTTVIDSQVLVHPKTLQLSSVDEAIVLENEEIFNKNGFYFLRDPNAPPTERMKLSKIPMSKSTIFGRDDIDEMIFMLKEGADSNCRPSRIRGMFAMRACRKSVMVGKALNNTAMMKVVGHMGDIEQPWNCPHGRPTMRHLINLNLLRS